MLNLESQSAGAHDTNACVCVNFNITTGSDTLEFLYLRIQVHMYVQVSQ